MFFIINIFKKFGYLKATILMFVYFIFIVLLLLLVDVDLLDGVTFILLLIWVPSILELIILYFFFKDEFINFFRMPFRKR